ncbi:aconitate hydratase, partial [bacterium]|nr:aconitate hydratase [bacterium]
ACVITGIITDPRELGKEPPEILKIDRFFIDDSMVIPPKKTDKKVEIYRGPNIGDPPKGEPLMQNIKGEVMLKVGDKITTDHIMPAGAYLKYRSNIPKYSEFVFEPVDHTFSERCLINKKVQKANIIVAGLSYGQGSSREHAAICPAYLGVKAVIAKSIERIHHSNLINFGILPLQFVNEDDYNDIEQGDILLIENVIDFFNAEYDIIVQNESKGKTYITRYTLSKRDIEIIKVGGLLNYIKKGVK